MQRGVGRDQIELHDSLESGGSPRSHFKASPAAPGRVQAFPFVAASDAAMQWLQSPGGTWELYTNDVFEAQNLRQQVVAGGS